MQKCGQIAVLVLIVKKCVKWIAYFGYYIKCTKENYEKMELVEALVYRIEPEPAHCVLTFNTAAIIIYWINTD